MSVRSVGSVGSVGSMGSVGSVRSVRRVGGGEMGSGEWARKSKTDTNCSSCPTDSTSKACPIEDRSQFINRQSVFCIVFYMTPESNIKSSLRFIKSKHWTFDCLKYVARLR